MDQEDADDYSLTSANLATYTDLDTTTDQEDADTPLAAAKRRQKASKISFA